MKTLPFFKFDAASWLTGKIQVLPIDEIGNNYVRDAYGQQFSYMRIDRIVR